ncbi:MAG TPA: ABC transporter ATP-binding protein [Proteobacteria bacterium]|nr:ABC transporter ATP-binding protein [Pseudomonadota bacterium]
MQGAPPNIPSPLVGEGQGERGSLSPVIKVENLCKHYGRRKRVVEAICDVSFTVNRGEIFGLIGPDGAGKTSIIQILAGVLSAGEGKASVAGIDVIKNPEAVKGIVGYMPQGLGLNLYDNLSMAENIAFFRDLRQVPADVYERNRKELLDMTRLTPFLGRQARHLSGGMRQKLTLICTLIHLPDVLLLDEPATGVDPISRQDFWKIIHRLVQERQVTVLLTTSYMDEAERCHRVALLHEGRIIDQGTPDFLKTRLTGQFLKVTAQPQYEALKLLRSWEDVESSEVFGGEIRVRIRTKKEDLISYLTEKGIGLDSIASYEAGFEDVFVKVLGRQSSVNSHRLGNKPQSALKTADSALPTADSSENILIQCNSVTRRFDTFVAVDRVDLSVMKGEVFGLLGPNGAGKTTLIKMMCGLLEPSEGSIKVAGFDVLKQRRQVWTYVGYMSQRFSLYRDLTVMENLRLYAGLYGVKNKDFKKTIEPLELSGMEDRLARDLPLGMRQRLALACALLHEPPVLFLDEPTSGVDPVARRAFWDIIYTLSRESRVTIIISTHYMDEAEHCDRLGLMHQGRLIAADIPLNLKSTSEKRSGSLIAIRTSDFRRAFDLITGPFPQALLYGSHIHIRTFNPESDKARALDFLRDAGITDVEISLQPLSMEETFTDYIRSSEETNA